MTHLSEIVDAAEQLVELVPRLGQLVEDAARIIENANTLKVQGNAFTGSTGSGFVPSTPPPPPWQASQSAQ